MKKKRRRTLCPCGSKKPYPICCGPFHKKNALPETPVELMRSRYTAYALGLTDYIIETTDPVGDAYEADLPTWRAQIERFTKSSKFLGVEILDSVWEEERGEVEFLARISSGGQDRSFEERSVFTRPDDRWLYLNTEIFSDK